MKHAVELAVVVPVYNEEDILWENLAGLADSFDRIVGAERWQYILVDNGSTDGTPAIVKSLLERWTTSITVHLDRPDYGRALRAGLEICEAPYAHIINVEQWDVPFIRWAWKNRERYDLFLGSKRADPTINRQSPYRRFLSWGLNAVQQLLFAYTGADTHGPKLLKMSAMRPVLGRTVMNRGQYDSEFTLRAIRAGLWVAEAPVAYNEQRPPRNLMISKIAWNVRDLVRLHFLLNDVPLSGPLRFHRWSRWDLLEED